MSISNEPETDKTHFFFFRDFRMTNLLKKKKKLIELCNLLFVKTILIAIDVIDEFLYL